MSDQQTTAIDDIKQFLMASDEPRHVVPDRLIKIKTVEQLVGLKKTTIYKLMREDKFPQKHPHIAGSWSLANIVNFIRTGEVH